MITLDRLRITYLGEGTRLRAVVASDFIFRGNGQQPSFEQQISGVSNEQKRNAGTVRNVQQGMLSIGKIQHPETGIDLGSYCVSPPRPVEVTFSELGFTEWAQIAVSAVVFQHVYDSGGNCERFRQLLRTDEIEIVGGSMILWKSSPNTS